MNRLTLGIALALGAVLGAAGCGTDSDREVTIDLGDGVTMKMVLLPAGSFTMGSPATEEDRRDDETQHEVTISRPFYMAVTEVTQAQWETVMDTNPATYVGPDLPVENVSWDDCQAFFKRLNAKVPAGGFRLPTEAEWEYACRAGTKTAYLWGDDPDQGKGWCNGYDVTANEELDYPITVFNWSDGRVRTAPVGSFKPNGWGLYDMPGNVYEWCQDAYAQYPQGPVTDPVGTATDAPRVARGGDWESFPKDCRSAARGRPPADTRTSIIGFRCARTVVGR